MVWSLGIHEAARWQFCKKSHRPFRICALAINSSALGPWPRPREIMSKCSVLPRSSLAKRNNWAAGSEPTTDWKGVQNGYNIDEKWQKNYFLSEFSCKKAGRMRSVHLLLNNMTELKPYEVASYRTDLSTIYHSHCINMFSFTWRQNKYEWCLGCWLFVHFFQIDVTARNKFLAH